MSPTIRTRKKQDYVLHVLAAVKQLAKENGQGASRQNIEKYLEGTLNDETNKGTKLPSAVVKSAILKALNSGLLVHASGVGLNGSFILPQKDEDLTTINPHEGKKAVVTKEAKLRHISSLASELQDTPPLETRSKVSADSNKRRRNIKLCVPFAETEKVKDEQLNIAKESKTLKTILKAAKERKLVTKVKRKNGARRVKFCSPPTVIFITPCLKRRSKRNT